jgi:hypothetical protein
MQILSQCGSRLARVRVAIDLAATLELTRLANQFLSKAFDSKEAGTPPIDNLEHRSGEARRNFKNLTHLWLDGAVGTGSQSKLE